METSASAAIPTARRGLTPLRLASDGRLARLAARGESRAFEAIFERYHRELYRYCRALLSNSDEAQDALQSTMTAALRSLPGEQRQIALRPWLYRVAHNEAISIARRRFNSSPPSPSGSESAAASDSVARDRERLRELVCDLRALPSRQCGALVMRELSGLGYAEIAVALGTSPAAARQLVYEAREAMRETTKGREMECSAVRETISERDGRMLRGRALRTHLRTCEPCRDFRLAISQRRSDLQALAPPPALAASGLLAAVLGKGGGGAGTAALGSGGMATGGGALALTKGNAIVAALAIGAGAAGVTGAVDVSPLGDGGSDRTGSSGTAPAAEGERSMFSSHADTTRDGSRSGAQPGSNQSPARRSPQQPAREPPQSEGRADRPSPPQVPPASPGGNGQGVPPAGVPGNGPPAAAGTGVGNAGGNSQNAPGITGASSRSETGALHSNAGAGGPPEHANGNGNPHASGSN